MEQQINQAVAIALSKSSDPTLSAQAIDFINQVKSTREGYDSCLRILTTSTINDEFKFFIFQVIGENLSKLDAKSVLELDTTLFEYFQKVIVGANETAFIKNKFMTIYAKVFCQDVPNFFNKWYLLLDETRPEFDTIADYFLRLMLSVHDEIADKLINRDQFIDQRNVYIKDQIRRNDMTQLIATWQKILTHSIKDQNQMNLNNVLVVIGNYVQWMEISLFIEHNFINLIIDLITTLNVQSCLTLIEILSKKMKSENKFQLINMVNLGNLFSNYSSYVMDLNFLETLAKLVNCIGYELCIIIDNTPNLIPDVLNHLTNLWPLIFNFLSNEYDEVSAETLPFIQYYLTLCKKNPSLVNTELFNTLLVKIIEKLKFDKDIDIDDDEIIEEFNEFRFKLKFFQDLIASLVPDLYISVLPKVIDQLLFDQSGDPVLSLDQDWTTFELGLFEFNNFSESIKNNLLNIPKQDISSSKPNEIFNQFYIKLINLNMAQFQHSLIQLNLFEILIKNFNLINPEFKNNFQLVYKLLEFFQSDLGLINPIDKIRFRCWYQFLRFIKLIKPGVINNDSIIESLFNKLVSNNLLVIKAEVPHKDEDSEIVELGVFNNQLYLFESIGLLISISDVPQDHKVKMIDLIVEPIFNELATLLDPINVEDKTLISLQIHHDLMAIGTFIRGFNYDQLIVKNLPQSILTKFHTYSQSILIVLQNYKAFEVVRESSRYCFARIIPILNDAIINELNKLISIYLSVDLQMTELSDFVAFINQIIHNYQKNQNIYNLLNNLLTPLLTKIFELIKTTDYQDPNLIRDQNSLKKSFLTLLAILVTNHQTSLLITESNKTILPQVLSKIFEICYDESNNDLTVNKLAIGQLINFVGVFQNGKINDKLDQFNNDLTIDGVDDYLVNNSINLSFELPFKVANKMIAGEISVLLKTLQLKVPEFPNLLSKFLNERGMNDEMKIGFINKLMELDQKEFKKFFGEFVSSMKT